MNPATSPVSTNLSPADETFQSLMHGGAVNGLCVCAGPKVIRSRMPFSTRRIENVARLIDEAFQHQSSRGRRIDRLWLGLGTVNLLAISHEGMRIIILHARDEETDFLVQAGLLFLKDYGADFIQLPEHKRLVTSRILVTVPDSEDGPAPPLPANPATSRIPLSTRFLEHQLSHGTKTDGTGGQPIIPKPIRRPAGDAPPSEGPPPTPTLRKENPGPHPEP